MPVQPALTGRHLVVVVDGRTEPRRRPLEHEQLAGLRRDLRDELHGARARADHCDPLAAQVDVVTPPRRVERGTRVGLSTRMFGNEGRFN